MTEYAYTPSAIAEWQQQKSRTATWVDGITSLEQPFVPPSRAPSAHSLWDGNGWSEEELSEHESLKSVPPMMVLRYKDREEIVGPPPGEGRSRRSGGSAQGQGQGLPVQASGISRQAAAMRFAAREDEEGTERAMPMVSSSSPPQTYPPGAPHTSTQTHRGFSSSQSQSPSQAAYYTAHTPSQPSLSQVRIQERISPTSTTSSARLTHAATHAPLPDSHSSNSNPSASPTSAGSHPSQSHQNQAHVPSQGSGPRPLSRKSASVTRTHASQNQSQAFSDNPSHAPSSPPPLPVYFSPPPPAPSSHRSLTYPNANANPHPSVAHAGTNRSLSYPTTGSGSVGGAGTADAVGAGPEPIIIHPPAPSFSNSQSTSSSAHHSRAHSHSNSNASGQGAANYMYAPRAPTNHTTHTGRNVPLPPASTASASLSYFSDAPLPVSGAVTGSGPAYDDGARFAPGGPNGVENGYGHVNEDEGGKEEIHITMPAMPLPPPPDHDHDPASSIRAPSRANSTRTRARSLSAPIPREDAERTPTPGMFGAHWGGAEQGQQGWDGGGDGGGGEGIYAPVPNPGPGPGLGPSLGQGHAMSKRNGVYVSSQHRRTPSDQSSHAHAQGQSWYSPRQNASQQSQSQPHSPTSPSMFAHPPSQMTHAHPDYPYGNPGDMSDLVEGVGGGFVVVNHSQPQHHSHHTHAHEQEHQSQRSGSVVTGRRSLDSATYHVRQQYPDGQAQQYQPQPQPQGGGAPGHHVASGPNPPSIVYAPARRSHGDNFSPPRIVYMHGSRSGSRKGTASPAGSVRRAATVHETHYVPPTPTSPSASGSNSLGRASGRSLTQSQAKSKTHRPSSSKSSRRDRSSSTQRENTPANMAMNVRSGMPMTYSQSSPLPANVALVRSPATMSIMSGGGAVPVPVHSTFAGGTPYPTPPGSTGSHHGHGLGMSVVNGMVVPVPANIAQSPQMSSMSPHGMDGGVGAMPMFVHGSVVPRSVAVSPAKVPKSASVTSLVRRGTSSGSGGGLLARFRDLRLGGSHSNANPHSNAQNHPHAHSHSGSHSGSHGHGRSHRSGSHRTGSSMSASVPGSNGRGRTAERGRGSTREEAGERRRRDRERQVESGRTLPKPNPQQRRAHSADSDASISSASTYYVIPQKGQKVRVIRPADGASVITSTTVAAPPVPPRSTSWLKKALTPRLFGFSTHPSAVPPLQNPVSRVRKDSTTSGSGKSESSGRGRRLVRRNTTGASAMMTTGRETSAPPPAAAIPR